MSDQFDISHKGACPLHSWTPPEGSRCSCRAQVVGCADCGTDFVDGAEHDCRPDCANGSDARWDYAIDA
jgi:hypothetical protein